MDPHKYILMIDSLARDYNYTHDEAFNLSVSEAFTYLVIGKKRDYIKSKSEQLQKTMEKPSK